MRRTDATTEPHTPRVRRPVGALASAAPVLLLVVGVALLLLAVDGRILVFGPDVAGLSLVVVGLVGLMRRLTAFDRSPRSDPGH